MICQGHLSPSSSIPVTSTFSRFFTKRISRVCFCLGNHHVGNAVSGARFLSCQPDPEHWSIKLRSEMNEHRPRSRHFMAMAVLVAATATVLAEQVLLFHLLLGPFFLVNHFSDFSCLACSSVILLLDRLVRLFVAICICISDLDDLYHESFVAIYICTTKQHFARLPLSF